MNGRRKRRAKQAGFTMVELLISIVVLMVGVLAVAQLIPHAMQTNFRNRNNSTALIWAQKTLEEIASQPIDSRVLFACAGRPAPVGAYAFCDREGGDGMGLGRQSILFTGAEVLVDGCPLDGTGEALDFTVGVGSCTDPTYALNRSIVWDVNTGALQSVEIRWHVVGWHQRGGVRRKVITVGARVGLPGQGAIVRNLITVVGR